jgi:threonylcarbamoyladenosine tRNA methylthiotransferase MtaB
MIQIHFETLGCKVNQIESESAARAFSDAGFSTDCKNYSAAEKQHQETILSIINTCTVTAKAEQKARRVIRMMLDLCPNACILVTGCYAEVAKEEILLLDKRVSVLRGQKKDFLQILAQSFSLYLKDAHNIKSDLPAGVTAVNNFLHDYEAKDCIPFLLSTDTFLNH